MAKRKGPKKTNRYPEEFKIKAVQLADHPDILAKNVAEGLGIHPIMLYRWRKEYRGGCASLAPLVGQNDDLKKITQENKQ
jgi:transposase-like protein